ncbi:peptidoglycan hydrolase CwlO-like protein [Enterococcus sp. PF1-24]|uniref:C40 family peptidase n=1 Tax=unclassified Enterococcus TaxID=2608891 RepID=UPI00247699E6|nr:MULTISPECIES: C40 family peptidase [unclassified Enterococcus]MDH6364249.1 peptidoglycan hydrolase CwlO-like protein [Enterococcus sp. PFB1-1]MDH6401392.1 peptidoglycan hydrolase CwlO-like protein [Enterococcus sp. PF1-24]
MKKTFAGFMVAGLFLSCIAPVVAVAEDFDTQIQEKDQKISDIQNQRSEIETQIANLEAEITGINQQAEELLGQQQQLGEASQQLIGEITALAERITKREATIQEQAREMQVSEQSANLVDAVLAADSLSDMISRVYAMNRILTANNELIVQQKVDKETVEVKKAENEVQQQQLAENQAVLETQKSEMLGKQADLDVLTATLAVEQATAEGEKAGLEQQKAEAERAAAALEAERAAAALAQANAAVAANNGVTANYGSPTGTAPVAPPAPNASGNDIINYAMQFIGVPYVWGGRTPSGFDCSGFCYYVYLNATGKNIGSWTVPQESCGTIISVSQAEAGDLLFWGSRGSTYHVALAMGGGQFIEAPTFGQTVSISNISFNPPSFAVRVS